MIVMSIKRPALNGAVQRQILVASLADWITRQQNEVIDYLRDENRVLKQQLGRKRLRLTDDQRRRLALRGKRVG